MMTELPSGIPVENVGGLTALGLAQVGEFSAVVLESRRDRAIAGRWQANKTHYVDLCLTGRPAPSRGRFVEIDGQSKELGDIFYVPAGLSLDTSGSAGWQRGLRLYCNRSDALPGFDLDFSQIPVSRWLAVDSPDVRRPLMQLCREVVCPGFASDIMVYGLCMTTMAELVRFGSPGHPDHRSGGLSQWRLRLLDERLNESGPPPTIRDLAQLCRLSERHLMRAFKEETGRKLGDHVATHTFDRACERLLRSDWKISRIAQEAGFKSASSFTAAFKTKLGVPPSVYRAESN